MMNYALSMVLPSIEDERSISLAKLIETDLRNAALTRDEDVKRLFKQLGKLQVRPAAYSFSIILGG